VDELKAIVDEAHGWGKKVACHAYRRGFCSARSMEDATPSNMGLEITDAQIAQMANKDMVLPTLAAVLSRLGARKYSGGQARPANARKVHGVWFKRQ